LGDVISGGWGGGGNALTAVTGRRVTVITANCSGGGRVGAVLIRLSTK